MPRKNNIEFGITQHHEMFNMTTYCCHIMKSEKVKNEIVLKCSIAFFSRRRQILISAKIHLNDKSDASARATSSFHFVSLDIGANSVSDWLSAKLILSLFFVLTATSFEPYYVLLSA